MSTELGKAVIAIEAIDYTKNVFGSLQANLSQLGGLVADLGGGFEALGSVIQGFAAGGVAGAAIAATSEFIQGLKDSVDAAADFEAAMNRIAASVGIATDAVGPFRDLILQVAPEFGRSLTETAAALEALAKAGVDVSNAAAAMEALRGTLQMAAIEGANAEEMAGKLAQAMAMFAIPAEEAQQAVDALVNASMAGIGTLSEFANGLGYVGSTAASLGLSLEETLAALVKIEQQLGSAEKAGRYLDAMFRDLIDHADDMNLNIFDQSGNLKDMTEIVKELENWLNQFATDQERAAALMENFGAQGARAVQMLVSMNEEGQKGSEILALLEEKLGATGSAAEAAAKQMEGYAAVQAQFNTQMEALQVRIGEALLPALTDFMKWINELMIELEPAIEELLNAFNELAAALGLTNEDVRVLGDFIKNFLIVEITGLAEIIKAMALAVEGWKMIFADVAEVIGPPIRTAIELIRSLIEVLIEAKQKWDEFFGGLASAKDEVGGFFDQITDQLSDAASKLTGLLGGGGEAEEPATPTPPATPPPAPTTSPHQGAEPYLYKESGWGWWKKKIYRCPVCGFEGSYEEVKEHIEKMIAKGMQEGGIVTSPMHALIGERGPEAVLPLSRLPTLLPKLIEPAPRTINIENNFTFTGPISSDVEVRELAETVSRMIAEKLELKYRARRMIYA